MGWRDNCPACGGHANSDGKILHKMNCRETVKTLLIQPPIASVAIVDEFQLGVMTNLVVMETRYLMRPHGGEEWSASAELVDRAMSAVLGRFGGIEELPATAHNQIINAVIKELQYGS